LPIVSASVHVPSDIPSAGRTLGVATAPVTLDLWINFQCSACRSFKEQIQTQLIANYVRQGKLKIVYHDFIVIDAANGGHDSENAAAAARIAADQGKFWAYVDLLWANRQNEQLGEFSRDRLIEMARMAGLDVAGFTADLDAGKYLDAVRAESAAGQAAALVAAPTVLVNGKVLANVEYATISAAIDGSLASTSPSATATATAAAKPTATAKPAASASLLPRPSSSRSGVPPTSPGATH
jgi:protein-disulfide isomerase